MWTEVQSCGDFLAFGGINCRSKGSALRPELHSVGQSGQRGSCQFCLLLSTESNPTSISNLFQPDGPAKFVFEQICSSTLFSFLSFKRGKLHQASKFNKQETTSHDVALHPWHLRLKGVVSEAGMGAHWHQLLSKVQVLKLSTNGHRGVMVDAVIVTQYLPTPSCHS